MSDKKTNHLPEEELNNEVPTGEANEQEAIVDEPTEAKEEEDPLEAAQKEIAALKDKHLRLYSEFENFRRRNAKERAELIGSAGSQVLHELLPVMDDLDRAITNNDKVDDINAVKEGFKLIDHKMRKALKNKGLEPMDAIGKAFDTDLHEAITKIPAPKKKLRGKVVDVVERGYMLNGKVLRYAKVVIGE